MKKWNSSPHPISDIRDWHAAGRLELRPDFQRKEVWSDAARIMLIDTILRDIPMPKIFLSNIIKDGHTHRTVVDGQQRIRTILSFLRNEFSLLKPYEGKFNNLSFQDLPKNVQDEILGYSIDFNEVTGISDEEVREVYSRVNKYTVALNKQELRRADFPGDFLDLAENLSLIDFFETACIFTTANRRRLGDVEYVSELLAGLIDDVQDKEETLDDFYQNYASWDPENLSIVKKSFLAVLDDIKKMFNFKNNGIAETRFRQKADFYSLFLAINSLHKNGYSLAEKDLSCLQKDLAMLDDFIEPHATVNVFREYATKCLSDANSKTSRIWRKSFLQKILSETYKEAPPTEHGSKTSLASILFDLIHGDETCPSGTYTCPFCTNEKQLDSLK